MPTIPKTVSESLLFVHDTARIRLRVSEVLGPVGEFLDVLLTGSSGSLGAIVDLSAVNKHVSEKIQSVITIDRSAINKKVSFFGGGGGGGTVTDSSKVNKHVGEIGGGIVDSASLSLVTIDHAVEEILGAVVEHGVVRFRGLELLGPTVDRPGLARGLAELLGPVVDGRFVTRTNPFVLESLSVPGGGGSGTGSLGPVLDSGYVRKRVNGGESLLLVLDTATVSTGTTGTFPILPADLGTVYPAGASARDSGIPTKDYQLAEYLYSRLREIDRLQDSSQGQVIDEVKRIRPSVDDSLMPEEIRGEYQLQRYLRMFGAAFNFTRTHIESSLFLTDAERCEAKWLLYVARIVGWDLNTELDVPTQRLEVLSAVELYKRKGTGTAVSFLINQLTDFEFKIVEMGPRILCTWGPDNGITPNPGSHLFDPSEGITAGTQDDKNFYTMGISTSGIPYLPTGVVLYLFQDLLNTQFTLLTSKIQKVFQEFAPFGVVTVMITIASYNEAPYVSELELKEAELVHHEDRGIEQWFSLRTWGNPRTYGPQNPGTLYDPSASLSYPLWAFVMREGNWSHAIV